jgi:hypothetical protein
MTLFALLLCLLPSPDAEPADAATHRMEWRFSSDTPPSWADLIDLDDNDREDLRHVEREVGRYFFRDTGDGLGFHLWVRRWDGVWCYRTNRSRPPIPLPARYR